MLVVLLFSNREQFAGMYACGCRYAGNSGCQSCPSKSKKTSNCMHTGFTKEMINDSCAQCSPENNCYYGSYIGNRAPHKEPLEFKCAHCKNRRYCSWVPRTI